MPSLEQPLLEGNIMVVDDNPGNLKLLEDTLRQLGACPRMAGSTTRN